MKQHYSFAVDREYILDALKDVYDSVLLADYGDTVSMNFGEVEIYMVIVDEIESEENSND